MIYPVYPRSLNQDNYMYYDFEENCIHMIIDNNLVIKKGNKYICTEKYVSGSVWEFYNWEDVNCDLIETGDNNFVELNISYIQNYDRDYRRESSFILKRTAAQQIMKMYEKRNKERDNDKKNIYTLLDKDVYEMAENLINIADVDAFLDKRMLLNFSIDFSYCNVEYYSFGELFRPAYALKGKEKKEAEKFNEELRNQISKISPYLINMTEIVKEEKKIKEHLARALVWEAVQCKMLEYFSQRWQEEFELKLETDYHQLLRQIPNSSIEKLHEEYIKSVFLCDEIDEISAWEILIYFLLSKHDIKGISLYNLFDEYEKRLMSIKKTLVSDDIKKKLKTKQKRKIRNYTITDVDLMTGSEFEEFVGLLFKKMGYAIKVTQKSGDQGVDVIASRNGTKIGIQAKCYSNTVGNSAVQEAIAGKSFYKCDKALVITNNYFTPAAIELSQASNVILWNRDLLKEKIAEFM